MSTWHSKQSYPSSPPDFGRITPEKLDSMSPSELSDYLDQALDSMTEETYDSELIDACLEALNRKVPSQTGLSTDEAYARFQQELRTISEIPEKSSKEVRHKYSRILRGGFVAAVTVICMLGSMVVAQTAGADVFGAMARWTEEVFSFGKIRDDGAKDDLSANKSDHGEDIQSRDPIGNLEYNSVQDALSSFGITEVTEPWLPERFGLTRIAVTSIVEADIFTLNAGYESNSGEHLSIDIMRYSSEPSVQVEKTDTSLETFEINGVTVSLIENSANYTLAWLTEHYECYISGADQRVLREIANSMIE